MQFLVIAYDGTDDKAPERRMAAREAHLAGIVKMKEEGKAIYGVAILNDREQMIGSALVVGFSDPSRCGRLAQDRALRRGGCLEEDRGVAGQGAADVCEIKDACSV